MLNAFPVSENALAALSVFRKTDRLVATPLLSAEVAAESASPRISRARRGGVTDLEFRGWNFASFTWQLAGTIRNSKKHKEAPQFLVNQCKSTGLKMFEMCQLGKQGRHSLSFEKTPLFFDTKCLAVKIRIGWFFGLPPNLGSPTHQGLPCSHSKNITTANLVVSS